MLRYLRRGRKDAVAATTVATETRILVADDEEPYLQATAFVLRGAGFDVTAVPEGNHAILAFEVALLAKRPYDLMLLDIRMPGSSGWEVLRYVNEHTPPGVRRPKVLLMTGFTLELDLDRVREDGAEGILLKPFTNNALVNEIRRHLAIAVPVPTAGGGKFAS